MSFFLLTYTRRAEAAPEIVRYEDSAQAMDAFVEAEHALRGSRDRGVVLLIADDEETLRKTHSHYFESVEELLALN